MVYPSSGPSSGVSPRREPQDTAKGAKESMARTGDDEPAIPRPIQDIVDEINTTRQRLSELWAAEYDNSSAGSTRAVYVAYPTYSIEDLARRKERDQLEEQERQLIAEFNEVAAAARIGPGGAINPDTVGKAPEGA